MYGYGGLLDGLHCHEREFYFIMELRGTRELNSNSTVRGVKEEMHWIPINELHKYKAYLEFLKEYANNFGDGIIHIIRDDREQVYQNTQLI